jgi:hypothetical protein
MDKDKKPPSLPTHVAVSFTLLVLMLAGFNQEEQLAGELDYLGLYCLFAGVLFIWSRSTVIMISLMLYNHAESRKVQPDMTGKEFSLYPED